MILTQGTIKERNTSFRDILDSLAKRCLMTRQKPYIILSKSFAVCLSMKIDQNLLLLYVGFLLIVWMLSRQKGLVKHSDILEETRLRQEYMI